MLKDSAVRTRYAPSPTGYMHIGNLRTALYEYLIARRSGGQFILRIEDTDQQRLVENSVEVIFHNLKLVGLNYDEGPYYQSERLELYSPYAEELVKKGEAYYCFCSKERLEKLKEEQIKKGEFPHYDNCCRNLAKEEIERNLALKLPYVIRQKTPQTGKTAFADAVYGRIEVENSEIEDQILLKSDGFPTYNFANVIDDHLMEITHVVRGSEYLTSTPKYNLIYEAFGWNIPTYVHLPLILNEEGRKLSKRLGDKSFEDLINEGYLAEAVINFIALLGWSPGDEREFFTLKELEESFTIEGINKASSIFDKTKLKWMNGEYIRKMSVEDFSRIAEPYTNQVLAGSFDSAKIGAILQKRVEVLTEIPLLLDFFLGVADYSTELYVHKKMKTDKSIALSSLNIAYQALKAVDDFREEKLHDILMELAKDNSLKNGQLLWPLRVALTGKEQSPGGAIDILDILGKDESLIRIEKGINLLLEELNNDRL